MEYNKINNLLGNTVDKIPKYVTNNWIEIHDHSGGSYNTSKSIKFKTQMLRSNLCDYSDAYVWVKGKITIANGDNGILIDIQRLKIMHHLSLAYKKLTIN